MPGPLSFEASIDEKPFLTSIQRMNLGIRSVASTAKKETDSIDLSFKRLSQVAAGYLTFSELSQLPAQIVKVRGEFQKLEIAFSTMLKSKAAGDELLRQSVELAASTPFSLKDVAGGAKQLLAYGSTAQSVIGEIRTLGDVAAGTGTQLGDLIYLYGTLRSQGRAYAVDIRQFAGRGIPIYAELAKVLGVNVDQVNSFVEAGKVGFKEVEIAFKNMTSGSGLFAGLMEAQSKSLTGLLERLGDAWDQTLNNIGKQNEELAADVINSATFIVENYENVVDILAVVISTYGAYKAAILAVASIKAAEATSALAVSAAVDKQSGSYAREIALKVKSTQATANRAAAAASEAAALSASEAANVRSLQTEVSALAAKKATTAEAARAALIEVNASKERLAAALANQAATAKNLSASVRAAAVKEVELAQNQRIVATENAVVARKAASAAASDFLAKKTALEAAAKSAAVLSTKAEATAKAASVAASNASAVASTRLTAAQSLQIVVTRQLAAAQAAWNASLLSNPIVLMAVAVAGLAAAVWALHDGTTAAEKAQRDLNEATERNKEQKQQLASATSELLSVLGNETSTKYAQLEAYQKLQSLYPILLKNLSLQEFQTLKAEEAQKKLNAAMDSMSIAQTTQSFAAAQQKVKDYETQLRNLEAQKKELGPQGSGLTVTIEDTRKAYEAAKLEAQALGKQVEANTQREWEANTPVEEKRKHYEGVIKSLEAEYNSLKNSQTGLKQTGQIAQSIKPFFDELRLTWLLSDLDKAKASLSLLTPGGAKKPENGGNKEYWEGVKKNATEALEKMGTSQKGSAAWKQLTQQINAASKELEKYDVVERRTTRKPKKVEIKIEKGSEADLEKQINTLNEKISKTSPAKVGTIQKYIAERTQLERKAEELRKAHSVKTFEEELQERQKKYALYQKWVEAYGKEAAQKQFSSLLKGGSDFGASLRGQLLGYDLKRGSGIALSKEELNQYQRLKELIADTDGHETILERFNKDLQAAKDNAGSVTEQIANLKKLQAALDPADTSETGIAKRKTTAEALVEAQKTRRQQVQEFLQSVTGSEQERLAIEKHYANLRAGLEEQYGTDRGEAYQKALVSINKDEQKALKDRKDQIFEESEAYKELQKVIMATGLEAMKARIEQLKGVSKLALETYGIESQEYKRAKKEEIEAEKQLADARLDSYAQFAQLAGELGQVLSEVNGTLGATGQLLVGLASGADNLATALKRTADGKLSIDQYVAAGNAAISLIGVIVTSAQQRQTSEANYYRSVIAYQHQYNLALNDQIGIQSKLNESVFVKDYVGRISDGMKQYTNAQKEYQEALDELEKGRARNGQRNAVDGKAVGQGAAAGAAIGSVVLPGIGTAVGAGVGAIIGLFAGKKKQDTWGALLEMYPGLVRKGADGWEELDKNVAQTLLSTDQLDEDTKQLVENAVEWTEKIEEAREKIREVISELAGGLGDELRNSLVDAFKAGENAAEAMRKTVSGVLEDLLSKIIFSKVFAAAFKDFEQQLAPALASGDPEKITDAFQMLFEKLPGLAKTAEDMLKLSKEYGTKAGFDLFSDSSSVRAKGAVGQVQSVTEETASVLVGQMNAIRINQAKNQSILVEQLQVQYQIANNTQQLFAISSTLVDIKRQLSSNPLRAQGLMG